MFPTRRKLVLAIAFLALAVLVVPERRLRAQPPGRGPGYGSPQQRIDPLSQPVTPEQVRAAFERNKQSTSNLTGSPAALPPGLEKLVPGLSKHFQSEYPEFEPAVADAMVRKLLTNPNFQNLEPQIVDRVIRQTLSNPETKQYIRSSVQQALANQAKTRPGVDPNSPQRVPPEPPDGPGPSTPPKTGPISPQPFPPDIGKGTPPMGGPKIRPDPGGSPMLKVEPEPMLEPNPNVPPKPKLVPDDVAGPRPIDIENPGARPGPQPNDRPQLPPQPPTPPKLDLGEGFRQPGSPDPNEDPEAAARRKRREAAAALWERSVGPLDETPAVKRALFDLVEGSDDFRDSEGNSFWDSLSKEAGDGVSFADWINKSATGDSWKLDFGSGWFGSGDGGSFSSSSSGESWWSRNFGSSSRSSSRSSSSSSSSGRSSGGGSSFGGFDLGLTSGGFGGVVWVLVLAALLVGGLLLWRYLSNRTAKSEELPFDLSALGAWPVDPRYIETREDLVKAFEYLSVMICGPAARMWTHGTIAAALADLATTHSEAAMILARLYELARYAPLDEPLTAAEIEESRRLVCRLAGVSYP